MSGGADIPRSAGITIIARDGVGSMETTGIGVTGIVGAQILILALDCRALAPAVATNIVGGTGIAIVAIGLVGGEGAAHFWGAGIVGARVVVVAIRR